MPLGGNFSVTWSEIPCLRTKYTRNFGDLEPFLAPQGFCSTIMLQLINFHCVQGGLWCVTACFLAVSKQSWAWMENTGCILVRFIIMINKWFTLTSVFSLKHTKMNFMSGAVCTSPVRCAAHRRKWMLMHHKWSLIQWCVWVLSVYCQDNERGWMFCIYKIHVSICNVLSSRATTCA